MNSLERAEAQLEAKGVSAEALAGLEAAYKLFAQDATAFRMAMQSHNAPCTQEIAAAVSEVWHAIQRNRGAFVVTPDDLERVRLAKLKDTK